MSAEKEPENEQPLLHRLAKWHSVFEIVFIIAMILVGGVMVMLEGC